MSKANQIVDVLLDAEPRRKRKPVVYNPNMNYIVVRLDGGTVHWVWTAHPTITYDKFNRPHFPFGSWLTAWQGNCYFSEKGALEHLQHYKPVYDQGVAPGKVDAYALVNEAVIGDGNDFDDILQQNEFDWRTWASVPAPSSIQHPKGFVAHSPDEEGKSSEWRLDQKPGSLYGRYRFSTFWLDDYSKEPRALKNGGSVGVWSVEQAKHFIDVESKKFSDAGWKVVPLS